MIESTEPLYRGRRIDTGELIEGYYYKIWDKRYILWGMTNGVPNMVEVVPSTVCQFTGIKNDTEMLWEGDKVKVHRGDSLKDFESVIEFKSGCFGVHCPQELDKGFHTILSFPGYTRVGSIHDANEI